MVRYGGFFKNILIHETITKVKGGSVCVWGMEGGGSNCSSIYTQNKNIPNVNRMKISCIFSLISQEKKCSEKWLCYR